MCSIIIDYFCLIGLESFCLSPQLTGSVSSSSPCSAVFSDDERDDFSPEHFDFQLAPELTRLDMVSSALEWLENLESCHQMRSPPPQLTSQNVSFQEPSQNMMTYRNTNEKFGVSVAVALCNPATPKNILFPQPDVVTGSGSNFPHCVPQQKARSPDSVNCLVPHHTGSDNEWKRERYAVPDECKDERYWRKRSRNNMSAKKSREAKRARDLLIAKKIDELEKENAALKMLLRNSTLQQPQQNNNGRCFCGNKLI